MKNVQRFSGESTNPAPLQLDKKRAMVFVTLGGKFRASIIIDSAFPYMKALGK